MELISALIRTIVKILIGWLVVEKVPSWFNLKGTVSTVVKVLGVLIIISALLDWL